MQNDNFNNLKINYQTSFRIYSVSVLIHQLLYTLMLWLTLRQFLREKRLTKLNVNSEGIILQPFGVIFSDPDEEMSGKQDKPS